MLWVVKIESTVFYHFTLHCFEKNRSNEQYSSKLFIMYGQSLGSLLQFRFGPSEVCRECLQLLYITMQFNKMFACMQANLRNISTSVILISNGEWFEMPKRFSVFRKVWSKRSFHLLGMSFGNGEWTFNETHKW